MYSRSSGERRGGDAETSGRAEPETRGRADPEKQRRETRAEQRRKGAEVQRRRGAKAQRCRGAKSQRLKPAEFRAKEREKKRVGTGWRARCYIESAPRRVRVVAIATRTQPRRGAHLAPPTPLIRAAHARTYNARTYDARTYDTRAHTTPLTRQSTNIRRM